MNDVEGTYYCQINDTIATYEVEAGAVYAISFESARKTKIMRIISYSDFVWFQDIDGNIRIIKDRITGLYLYEIANKDEELMKKFMWAKLKSKRYAGYA